LFFWSISIECLTEEDVDSIFMACLANSRVHSRNNDISLS
jgi:hypothetical protein